MSPQLRPKRAFSRNAAVVVALLILAVGCSDPEQGTLPGAGAAEASCVATVAGRGVEVMVEPDGDGTYVHLTALDGVGGEFEATLTGPSDSISDKPVVAYLGAMMASHWMGPASAGGAGWTVTVTETVDDRTATGSCVLG